MDLTQGVLIANGRGNPVSVPRGFPPPLSLLYVTIIPNKSRCKTENQERHLIHVDSWRLDRRKRRFWRLDRRKRRFFVTAVKRVSQKTKEQKSLPVVRA